MQDMGLREDLTRKIEKKRAEILELETQVRLAREYLQALEDTMKMVPREVGGNGTQTSPFKVLRAGSSLSKARDAIRKAGRPLHITEILSATGKGNTRNERAGLSGTLATYVRKGVIFTRPAPNTFGLAEFDRVGTVVDEIEEIDFDSLPPEDDVPPAGFGKL